MSKGTFRSIAALVSRQLSAGGWYLPLTILSFGFLAAVPFWHASRRVRRPRLRKLALLYTAVDVVLVAFVPTRPGGLAESGAANTAYTVAIFVVVIVACIQLRAVRHEVYDLRRLIAARRDPAVARVLAARSKRENARRLLAEDPMLARELGIGRPDLGRDYDDGGLVDINTAPATVIASVCEMEKSYADAIVASRDARDGYHNLGQLLVDVSLPPRVQEQLRDRAIV